MVNNRIEKYGIFSKGFRGVPDGWHNLRSCNFLIGENSTGKSSFLQLIELIDSRAHMLFLDILGVVKGVDTASDVCSRATGATSTTIGYLIKEHELEEPKTQRQFAARLATYRKRNDELRLTKLTILAGGYLLRLKLSNKKILYRFDSFTYFNHLSHAENGERLSEMHNQSEVRFKNFPDGFEAKPEDNEIAWLAAINAAAALRQPKSSELFHRIYAPLNCVHYGPMRAKARRLYYGAQRDFSSTGEHFAFVLRDVAARKNSVMSAVEQFGKESGLFDRISITSVKTPVNDRPFALQVKKSNSFYYVDELGYGVGQILPIIGDLAFAPSDVSFLIEQPELHLHPRAQAALGELFFAKAAEGTALVVETHSDFILDRFRMSMKGYDGTKRYQIIYFDKDAAGKNRCHEIEIFSDGSVSAAPEGYRNFFVNEGIDKFEALL